MADSKPKIPRLTWRKQPNERGLSAVAQGPRGYDLRVAGEDEIVGRVRPRCVGFHQYQGWYWYARHDSLGVPLQNTAAQGLYMKTPGEAQADCEAYVRGALAARPVQEG